MNKKELENYFKSDKTDWYVEYDEGHKEWNYDKVTEFWKRIRVHKIFEEDYDFSDYIFPEFEDFDEKEKGLSSLNFSTDLREAQTVFSKKVNFFNTIFLGRTNFTDCLFEEKVDFSEANFNEDINITSCVFSKVVSFKSTIFYGALILSHSEFRSKVNFNYSEFKELILFNHSIFNRFDFLGVSSNWVVHFSSLIFRGSVTFFESTFKEEVYFNDVLFQEEVEFSGIDSGIKTQFYKVLFIKKVAFDYARIKEEFVINSCVFLGKCTFVKVKSDKFNFEDLNQPIQKDVNEPYFFTFDENLGTEIVEKIKSPQFKPNLIFDSISFSTGTVFTRLSLNEVEFYNCDISNVKFSRCNWSMSKKRIVLRNEEVSYKDSEVHYRQLKKNFDSEKNWEYSGYAYVSEMEMRKNRLWKEKRYADWFIYKFYDFFGGYTQDYIRPLRCLFILTSISTIIYYFMDYSVLKAIQRGIKGAIPYLQIDTEKPFYGYWLIWKNIQLMLSSIFLTFFILALRKRFKQ